MLPHRYSAWDGSQDPLSAELPLDDLVEQLSEDLLNGWSADESLERLLRQGMPGQFSGLDQLRARIEHMRQAAAERLGADGPIARIRERVEEIVHTERMELSVMDSDDARFREVALEALPDSLAETLSELKGYEFVSEEARQAFEDLLNDLRRDIMDRMFREVSEAMSDPDPETMAVLKDMLADLNGLLDQRQAGTGPSDDEFAAFMDKHGQFFPENPATLDELLEALAKRAAAFSRFMANLSPDQRAELDELMNVAMDDLDLAFQMDHLGSSLRALAPDLDWNGSVDGAGGPTDGLGAALNAIEDLSAMQNLERALGQNYPGASLADVDPEELARMLDGEARRDLERLKKVERALERAGVVVRSSGRLELTPRGVRKLGEQALSKVFEHITVDRPGSHDVPSAGGMGEPTGTSRPWNYGDTFRLDLQRTLGNAVVRGGVSEGGKIQLSPEDFEIAEHETKTSVATVLLLDMSRSMPLRGHWLGAKRMALALHALITTAYPEDHLEIVAFSDYARVMSPADLGRVDWEPVYGTNMEHAFSLAGRILARHRDATKQVLLVTDGEPTAHLEGDDVFFQWPPARRTIDLTFKEAMRLAKSGVTMNIFMLEQEPGLVAFVDRLAKIVHGRVFAARSDELGDMIVRDYLKK
jgi:uncharacterized protein with von Willebrand factor type A (vWA) domain